MPEPGIPQHLHSQPFTHYQVRQASTPGDPLYLLLESLAFESVFSVHDDFDLGINSHRWVSSGFNWQEDDFFGSVANIDDTDDLEADAPPPTDAYLFSRVKGWRAGRRAVVMVRFTLSSLTAGKLEIGFSEDMSYTGYGVVANVDALTNHGIDNYGFTVWDPSESSSLVYAVARGHPDDGEAASGTPQVPFRIQETSPRSRSHSSERTNTIITATNENGEVATYINGQRVVHARVTGPNATADMGIWVHVGPNSATGAPVMNLDYIHGWQERNAL